MNSSTLEMNELLTWNYSLCSKFHISKQKHEECSQGLQ